MPTLAELVELSRTELQAVAKEYGVKANQTSAAILAELTEVLSKSTAVAEDAALEPEATVSTEEMASDAVTEDAPKEDEPIVEAAPDISDAAPMEEPAAEEPEQVEAPMVEEAQPTEEPMPVEEPVVEEKEEVTTSVAPEVSAPAAAEANEQMEELDFEQAEAMAEAEAEADRLSEGLAAQAEAKSAAPAAVAAAPKPAVTFSSTWASVAAHVAVKTQAAESSDSKMRKANGSVLPRVATLGQKARAKLEGSNQWEDRFGGYGSLYKVRDGPSVNAYADAAMRSTNAGSAPSMDTGYADRFQGPDSRYRKGLRQSALPIHDSKVYEAKQMDESIPLPAVASIAPVGTKREIMPGNIRFEGVDSIYNVPVGPAPTAYDPSAADAPTASAPSFEHGYADRFAGPTSLYNAPVGPSVTHYDTTAINGSTSSLGGIALDKQSTDRFEGANSIYNAPAGPADGPMAYDATAVKDAQAASQQAIPFDKGNADRFAGPDSLYNVPAGPAVTAYDAVASLESIKNSVTSHVKSFESGNADRFAGHDSLYRKGLRRSTVPEARDPSSFRGEAVKAPISKNAMRGASLRANLKSMISKDMQLKAVAEDDMEEIKENEMIA